MKRRNQGFTLIELLAVIVILAVLAFITVPLILGVIETSQKGAFQSSVYAVFDSLDYYLWGQESENLPEEGIAVQELDLKHKEQFLSGVILNKDGILQVENVGTTKYCANGPKDQLVITAGPCITFDGVPSKEYEIGESVRYADLDWYVVKDQTDAVTLIHKDKINSEEVSYGETTDFEVSNIKQYMKEWLKEQTVLKKEITAGGVLPYFEKEYLRLLKKEEVNEKIPYDNMDAFWTMSALEDQIFYVIETASLSYQKYEDGGVSTTVACRYGGPYANDFLSTQVGKYSNKYNRILNEETVETLVAPTVGTAVQKSTYVASTSPCCYGCGACSVQQGWMVCGNDRRSGYSAYSHSPADSYVVRNWQICADATKAGCNSTYVTGYTFDLVDAILGVRPVITVKKK